MLVFGTLLRMWTQSTNTDMFTACSSYLRFTQRNFNPDKRTPGHVCKPTMRDNKSRTRRQKNTMIPRRIHWSTTCTKQSKTSHRTSREKRSYDISDDMGYTWVGAETQHMLKGRRICATCGSTYVVCVNDTLSRLEDRAEFVCCLHLHIIYHPPLEAVRSIRNRPHARVVRHVWTPVIVWLAACEWVSMIC